jgi:hypothetical protein|tara:strand:- start:1020 stop:2627 length:1608 start_codon:yes stop_codon:yes gene_type:complete
MKIRDEKTTVQNVSIQNVGAGGASVSVNGTSLDPAPFVSLSTDQYRVGELIVGGVLSVSLNGTIYTASASSGGFSNIAGKANNILNSVGSSGDCVNININCNGTVLVNGFGTIRSVSVEEGPDPTWTKLATYNIEIEMYHNNGQLAVKPNTAAGSYVTTNEIIKDVSESVTLNVDNDGFAVDDANGTKAGRAHAKYSFSISATGGSVGCKGQLSQKTGIEAAEEVVKRRISSISSGSIGTGLGSPSELTSQLNTYHSGSKKLHVRNVDADPINGSMTVSGDIILRPSGCTHPEAFIDITVDSRADSSQVGRTVTVSGTVEGLYSHDFNSIITNGTFHSHGADRLGSAEGVYNSIKGSFESMAQTYLEGILNDTSDCTNGGLLGICETIVTPAECNLREVNKSVTRNFGQGTVSFTHEYSTARNCSIPGAAKTDIEISHTYPTDVFAEFTIPFRGGGPLLQSLGTTTKETISVNVNVTVDDTGCEERYLTSCATSKADEAGNTEGAGGWYLTQNSITKTNTGSFRVTKEWTKPSNC